MAPDALETTATTDTTTPLGEAPTQLPTSPTSSALECRLCEMTFKSPEEKRQHAKSEWHVYKIRCRVAEPGTIIPPPTSSGTPPPPPPPPPSSKKKTRIRKQVSPEDNVDLPSSSDSEISSSDESPTPSEFNPGQCLFCNTTSQTLEESLTHMHQSHGLIIPNRSGLTVDLHTLVWYLHLVIFDYRECICCGKKRRTVEAVQQHMTSTGHCRFDITDEYKGFYDEERVPYKKMEEEDVMRLPSGKMLGSKTYVDPNVQRQTRGAKAETTTATLPPTDPHNTRNTEEEGRGSSTSTELLAKKDRHHVTQFSRLRASDQTALIHLPVPQQLSLLAARKREMDVAKRAEIKGRRRVDNVGNKTAVHTKYYKQEVPVYMGG